MRVNKIKDLVERVGWTGIEAASGSILAILLGATLGWEASIKVVASTTAIAMLKVIVSQRFSKSKDGSAIPGGIVEKTNA